MPATFTTPDRLLAPEAEMLDDPAPQWPGSADSEPGGWEPGDADLAGWEPGDADLAGWEPGDADLAGWEAGDLPSGSPEAGAREVLKAGFWDRERGDGGGFAAGGVADDLPPGPVLAGFAANAWAAGLGRLSDDELIGVMRAARRLASWAAAMELAGIGDLWRRRVAEEEAGDPGAARHANDELAAALTLTGRAADRALGLAVALRRLPLASKALAAGDIDLPRAMVIADEVTGLDDEHAAAVEQAIAGSAAGQTTGQLRAATRRAVMAADPSAARRRKEQAQQDARVERWDEHAGTAALAGRDLPPASVLAADQNLTALARQLKAAGLPGAMDTLRAEAFLALLTGASAGSLLPGDPAAPHESAATGGSTAPVSCGSAGLAGFLGDLTPPGSPADPAVPVSSGPGETVNHPSDLSRTANHPSGPRRTANHPSGPSRTANHPSDLRRTVNHPSGLSGTVNLTMPLATWLGLSDAPGDASGYGVLDASDSRDLARALAARAGNRWCLTFTGRTRSAGRPRLRPGRADRGPTP